MKKALPKDKAFKKAADKFEGRPPHPSEDAKGAPAEAKEGEGHPREQEKGG
jgi:hypothetical protein